MLQFKNDARAIIKMVSLLVGPCEFVYIYFSQQQLQR